MPLEEYVANYDSILENKPFKFGNMKGKVLNKSKFFNDYSDYEILLRNEIPSKYFKYFNNVTKKNYDEDGNTGIDDDLEIEYGRSSRQQQQSQQQKRQNIISQGSDLNLSPVKNQLDAGIKDSQVISKEENKIDSPLKSTSSFCKTSNKLFNDENEYSLDLGNLNINNLKKKVSPKSRENIPKASKKIDSFTLDVDQDLEDMDEIYEKTFKLLNKNSLVDNEGKQLNSMIQSLLETLKTVKQENDKLKGNNNEMKLIIKDLNILINSYKLKLRDYYQENKSLKAMIKNERNSNIKKKIRYEEPVTDINDLSEEDDSTMDDIDRKIKALQEKKKHIQHKKATLQKDTPEVDFTNLSENIVQKIMYQLKEHLNHSNKPNENFMTEKNNEHGNCPFCKKSESENILSKLLVNSDSCASQINLEELVELLADRFKFKLDNLNSSKTVPDVW